MSARTRAEHRRGLTLRTMANEHKIPNRAIDRVSTQLLNTMLVVVVAVVAAAAAVAASRLSVHVPEFPSRMAPKGRPHTAHRVGTRNHHRSLGCLPTSQDSLE